MSYFYAPKITSADATKNKVKLSNADIDIEVKDNFTELNITKNSEHVSSVNLKNGIFEKLLLGINENQSAKSSPFKDANLKFDAESMKISDNTQIKVCKKSDQTDLPDIILKKDGGLEFLDWQDLCQECVETLVFQLKNADIGLVDKLGQRISPWNAIDLYHQQQKIATYQGKVIASDGGKKFYLATSGDDLRLIDADFDNFTKAKFIKYPNLLSDLELVLSKSINSDLKMDLLLNSEKMEEFADAKSPVAKEDLTTIVDFFCPVKNQIEDFTDLIC